MTLSKVAEKAGVAIDTARRALRNEPSVRPYIRERVVKAAEQLDYSPNLIARALRDKNVSLIPISVNPFNQHYFGMLSFEFARKLVDIGMEPALCFNTEHLTRMCKSFRVRGCLLAEGTRDELIEELARKFKVIVVNLRYSGSCAGRVSVDFDGVYRKLARRLLEEGRRSIAIVSEIYVRAMNRGWSLEKFPVVLRMLKREGLELAGGRVFETAEEFAAWMRESGKRADAVLCEQDMIAAMVIGEMARMGLRTPEDILVVGCDASLVLPGAWSVKLDNEVIAGMAVELLRKALESGEPLEPVVYKPVLVDC